jgi:serine protease inhibitor
VGRARYVLTPGTVISDMRRVTVAFVLAAFLLPACGAEPPGVQVQRVSLRLTDSSAGFGLKLLDRLLAEKDAGNVFISPLSATILLSMVASAANGETRAAMLTALGLDPKTDPSGEIAATVTRLAQSDSNAQLELAQAVWTQNGMTLSPAYVNKLRDDYRAEVASLDFGAPTAPGVVNRWVDNATHHKIDSIVDGFDPSTVGFLVNATYFHALWRTEFKAHGQGDFRTFAGPTATVPMMRRDNVTLLRTPTFDAALLPYKGGRFSALIVVPHELMSPHDFAGFLTPAAWNQAVQQLHTAVGTTLGGTCEDREEAPGVSIDCRGTLVMPKFKLEYRKDLTATLTEMGYPVPAGLPGFCAGCALSYVVQKTYLEVDEKGTTAAAVTGGAVVTSLPVPLVVDRPFALALIDNATDAPLFLGAIGNLP